jgi:hypothetical protein
MVAGVHVGGGCSRLTGGQAERCVQAAALADGYVVPAGGDALGVKVGPMVATVDVLEEPAAEGDVQELVAAADSQDGYVVDQRLAEQDQLNRRGTVDVSRGWGVS